MKPNLLILRRTGRSEVPTGAGYLNPARVVLIIWVALTVFILGEVSRIYGDEFKYLGYDIEFNGNQGDTKYIWTENTDITTTGVNTFSATSAGYTLSRTIANQSVSNPYSRVINQYSAGSTLESGVFDGTLEFLPNNVLRVSPDNLNFYFNSTGNVALAVSKDERSTCVSLLIRKSDGLDNASVSGPYVRFTMANSFYGDGQQEALEFEHSIMQFDGLGGYTESATTWETQRMTTEREVTFNGENVVDTYFSLSTPQTEVVPYTSTYAVGPGGSISISTAAGPVINQVSPDGNLAVAAANFGQGACLSVAVKQPQNMPTNAVEAIFTIVELYELFSGNTPNEGADKAQVETILSYLYLHSDGTFELLSRRNPLINTMVNNRYNTTLPEDGYSDYVSSNLFSVTNSAEIITKDRGTYTISSSGLVTVNFKSGKLGYGQLSANGEYLVYGVNFSESYYRERGIVIGVRRAPPEAGTPTSTGMVVAAVTPASCTVQVETSAPNAPVEIVYSDNLTNNTWESAGVFSSETGIVEFTDSTTANVKSRFYSTADLPW